MKVTAKARNTVIEIDPLETDMVFESLQEHLLTLERRVKGSSADFQEMTNREINLVECLLDLIQSNRPA
jgi:hypothetical protein